MSSLVEIFNNCLYRIPDYQRGYSWDEPQLRDFWQDLSYVTSPQVVGGYSHFFGTLTLEPLTDDILERHERIEHETSWLRSEGYRGYFIVDGQQRLTTIMILLKVLVDWVSEMNLSFIGETNIEEITNRYLYRARLRDNSRHYIFGYEADDPSYEFWRDFMLGDGQIDDRNFVHTAYTRRLRDAYDFFRKQIHKDYTQRQPANPEQYSQTALGELYAKIRTGLLINLDVLTPAFNVGIVFETMNNRGKKLSLLELLKNRLIYLATRLDDHTLRRSTNEVWRSIYHYLGKNEGLKLDDDDFLKTHYIAYFGYNTDANQYREGLLNNHFNPSRLNESRNALLTDINNYIASLRTSITIWYEYQSCEADVNRGNRVLLQAWLQNMKLLGYGSFEPLMLAAMMSIKTGQNPNSEDATGALVHFIKALERVRFIAFSITNQRSHFKRPDAYNLALELMHRRIGIDAATQLVDNWISHIQHPKDRFYQMVKDLFDGVGFEGFYGWSGIKYFLYRYEASLAGDAAPMVVWTDFSNATIEHIYPQQTDANYWNNAFQHLINKRNFMQALGNLAIASGRANAVYGNRPYTDEQTADGVIIGKRSLYEMGSHSLRSIARDYADWKPDAIIARTRSLLIFIKSEWRIPDTIMPSIQHNYEIYKGKFGLLSKQHGMN